MDQVESSNGYGLREVVAITGISKQRLYAWQHRHGILEGGRDISYGKRRYSEADVIYLQLLYRCITKGHPIGSLSTRTAAELRSIGYSVDDDSYVSIDDLVELVGRRQASQLQDRLSMLVAALGPMRFLRQVSVPFMAHVGRLWSQGDLCPAEEHLVTGTVRTLLGQALLMQPANLGAPVAVLLTPEGELHECGALGAALIAKHAGLQTHYPGAQVPKQDIAALIRHLGARLIGVSGSCLPTPDLITWVRDVAAGLAGGAEIWLGGRASQSLSDDDLPEATIIRSEPEFEDAIERFKVRQSPRRGKS